MPNFLTTITSPQHAPSTLLVSLLIPVFVALFLISTPVAIPLLIITAVTTYRRSQARRRAVEAARLRHLKTWGW